MTPKRRQHDQKDKEMAHVIGFVSTVFIVLCTAIVGVFGWSVFVAVNNGFSPPQPKDILAPTLLAFAGLVGVLAFMRDWNKMKIERLEANGKMLYDHALEGFTAVSTLLSAPTQNQEAWHTAAQLLGHVVELGQRIDAYSYYTQAFALTAQRQRLALRTSLSHNNQALPPAFFFGASNWSDSTLNLDDVRRKTDSKVQIIVPDTASNSIVPYMGRKHLDEKSVATVYNFVLGLPLDTPAQDWPEDSGVSQGARRYLLKQVAFGRNS